jgi:hypothetical protein
MAGDSIIGKGHRRSGVILRELGGISVAAVVAMAPVGSALHIQRNDILSVDDPRPLSAAIKLVEGRCHCAITYEDPKWRAEDVIDISGSVWHRADVKPRVPKGGRFTFSVDGNLAARSPAQIAASVQELVHSFNESGTGPGTFKLFSDGATIHVTPRNGSILDGPVTIASGEHSIAEVVVGILGQVEGTIGTKVGLATFPQNLLKRPVRFETQHESAQRALTRALVATERVLSWRLYYDVGMGQYYFGIHFVP